MPSWTLRYAPASCGMSSAAVSDASTTCMGMRPGAQGQLWAWACGALPGDQLSFLDFDSVVISSLPTILASRFIKLPLSECKP